MSASAITLAFRQWIKHATGLDITFENQAQVELALRILSDQQGLDQAEYVDELMQGAMPAQAFIDEITTNESYFFRAIEQMRYSVEHIIPDCIRRNPDRPVRILSMPCARGEEPYSLAMLLREQAIPASRVQIVGVDISQHCIQAAHQGRYNEQALRRTSVQHRQRWFVSRAKNEVQLDSSITTMVDFYQTNLFTSSTAGLGGKFDIVFCENLLIYFDQATTDHALRTIKELMQPDGWLFVDHSEWNLPRAQFEMQREGNCVGFRPSAQVVNQPSPTPRPEAWATSLPPVTPPRQKTSSKPKPKRITPRIAKVVLTSPEPLVQQAEHHYQHKRFVQALQAFEQAEQQAGCDLNRILLGKARVLADCGEDFEAMECSEQILRQTQDETHNPYRPEALGLLAVLLHKKGMTVMAQQHLQELAALKPEHPALKLSVQETPHA